MSASVTIWQPNPPKPGARFSSQELFLECPYPEALYEGGRGPGKTSGLIMDFALDTGQGLGEDWRGILFRRSFKELADVVAKSRKVFSKAFPKARFYESASAYFWEWPDGERLYFRHMKKPEEYWNYHGHEYPWQGWEELTTWPNLDCYQQMVSCLRSSNPAVAKIARRRATTNPWGVGHGAVKQYFVDPAPVGTPILDEEGNKRVRYYGPLEENRALLGADPNYIKRTLAGISDDNLKKAWKGGADRWEIAAGAFFADVWRKATHVIPAWKPPKHWTITRSFDWGSAAPFACGWYAESPGETVKIKGRSIYMPPGTLVRFAEWYGASAPNVGITMLASDVAKEILRREMRFTDQDVKGVADSAMWIEGDKSNSIYGKFEKEECFFEPCKKGPGSRVAGWETCRERLVASIPIEQDGALLPPENPGFYVTENCIDFIRTITNQQRDPSNPEDIDSEGEDHLMDEWRYRLSWEYRTSTVRETNLG